VLRLKKRKPMLCAVLAGMLLAAWTAHADGEIKVIIDGQEVRFGKSPVVDQGAVLVPFRVLFQKLGLFVDWNPETKSISGYGGDVSIKLYPDRNTAVINGKTVELAAPPRIMDGSVYVPLRLVGEATGRTVNWDGATRTITIDVVRKAPASAVEFDFEAFYRSFLAAGNAEDSDALLDAIHIESPTYFGIGGSWVRQLDSFMIYDIVTELVAFEVVEADETHALLRTVEKRTNTNGLFYPDNRVERLVSLVKDRQGQWQVYDLENLDLEYLVSDEALTAEADIDEAAKQAVLDAVAANLEATYGEDFEAMLDTYDPMSSAARVDKDSLKSGYLLYDLDFELEYSNVIEVTDSVASVYVVQTLRRVDGFEYGDNRSKWVHAMRKQADGSWKLYMSHLLSVEPLNE